MRLNSQDKVRNKGGIGSLFQRISNINAAVPSATFSIVPVKDTAN